LHKEKITLIIIIPLAIPIYEVNPDYESF